MIDDFGCQTIRKVLDVSYDALMKCRGLANTSNIAYGKALRALNAVGRGSEGCRAELASLKEVLQVYSGEIKEAVTTQVRFEIPFLLPSLCTATTEEDNR